MKKAMFFIMIMAVVAGCAKTSSTVRLIKITKGGCAGADKIEYLAEDPVNDTAYCTFDNSKLNLFVGFNNTCCSEFSTEADAEEGVITANVTTTTAGLCNCICYYTYTFSFTGINDNWTYVVNMDGEKKFSGKVKPGK
jgi:hypothetical protein